MNASIDVTNVRLESKRLILREWKSSDLDDFFEYASVPEVGEMAGWPHHKNKDESLVILNRFINNKRTFALVYKDNNKVIGSLGIEYYGSEDKLTELSNLKGREIGYVLSKDYWGQGLMVEAVQTVIDYLFNKLDYDFLLCGHFDKNNRSKRVQEKCGFIPYRKLVFDTKLGTKEPGVLLLLTNPRKNIELKFSHPETLLIGRLHLSKVEDKDKKEVIDLISDPRVKETYMLPDFNDENEKELFFEKLKILSHSHKHCLFGIYLKDKLVGLINDVNIQGDEIEVGYCISSSYWNKGFASEALKLFIDKLFVLGFKKVKASHFIENPQSGRVMQKCGMHKIDRIGKIKYREKNHDCIYYEIERKS